MIPKLHSKCENIRVKLKIYFDFNSSLLTTDRPTDSCFKGVCPGVYLQHRCVCQGSRPVAPARIYQFAAAMLQSTAPRPP